MAGGSLIIFLCLCFRSLPDIAFSLCGGLPSSTAAFLAGGSTEAKSTEAAGAGAKKAEEVRPFSNLLFEQSLISYDDFVMRLKVNKTRIKMKTFSFIFSTVFAECCFCRNYEMKNTFLSLNLISPCLFLLISIVFLNLNHCKKKYDIKESCYSCMHYFLLVYMSS